MTASSSFLNEKPRTEAQARADIAHDRALQRWHREGWRTCGECLGDGYTEDMGDRFDCQECHGTGEVKLSFWDWLEEIEAAEEAAGDRRELEQRITRSATE